jgi:hypothetical protein
MDVIISLIIGSFMTFLMVSCTSGIVGGTLDDDLVVHQHFSSGSATKGFDDEGRKLMSDSRCDNEPSFSSASFKASTMVSSSREISLDFPRSAAAASSFSSSLYA